MNDFLKNFSLKPLYQVIGSCEIEISRPFCLVIFGAAGDLTKRKLISSIYHLYLDGLLPDNSFICINRRLLVMFAPPIKASIAP